MRHPLLLLALSVTLFMALACGGIDDLDDPSVQLERDLERANGLDETLDVLERHTEALDEKYATPKPGGSLEKAEEALARTYVMVMDKHPPRTPIVDDAAFRERRQLAAELADLTGLDFVQLAVVQLGRGLYGIRGIVDELGTDEMGTKARLLVQKSLAVTGMSDTDRLTPLFEAHRDPKLDAQAQREAWLDLLVDGQRLTRAFPSQPLAQDRAPKLWQCAELTGLPADKLTVAIGSPDKSAGQRITGLLHAMPDLPGKEACLAQWKGDAE